MRAEGLFLNFTTSEITTIQTKAKTLLTEGKTLMAYGIGGRNATKLVFKTGVGLLPTLFPSAKRCRYK